VLAMNNLCGAGGYVNSLYVGDRRVVCRLQWCGGDTLRKARIDALFDVQHAYDFIFIRC
jgi:hypothetical protein